VQTGRQSGLSAVYSQLLDFESAELYLQRQPELAGKTFGEAIFAYGTSALVGVATAAGEVLVPPPLDRKFEPGDDVIAITHDDDVLVLDGGRDQLPIDADAIVATAPDHTHAPERTLVLGASVRTATVVRQLDAHVAPGSEIVVVGEDAALLAITAERATLTTRVGDLTDRSVLDSLDATRFDHVLVLSETRGRTQEMADARTTVILLHLRDIERRAGKRVPITSEILDILNRDLAAVAEADDFIVSNTLVSLMVGQLAQNPRLVRVFDELFSTGGHEIYLKPAARYVRPGEVSFATVCEAALRRDEVAIGYRLARGARDAAASYGVVVDPPKRARVRLGVDDRVIVLATD
jgi:voltage-gated potassium channel Kch